MQVIDQEKLEKYYKKMFVMHRMPRQQEQDQFDQCRVDDLQVGDKNVAMYMFGHGQPVLLVHGVMGRATQLKALSDCIVSKGYSVVTFDLPAHGESTGDTTNTREIMQLLGIVSRKYGPFKSVVAHSFGCIAACCAIEQSLVETSSFVAIASPSSQQRLMHKTFSLNKIDREYRQPLIEKHKDVLGENFLVELSPMSAIPKLQCRHLLVHGQQDPIISTEEFGELVERKTSLTDARQYESLNHWNLLSESQVISDIVSFFDSIN